MSSAAQGRNGGCSRLIGELRKGGRIPLLPPAPSAPPSQSQSRQSQRFHPLMPSALLYRKGKVAWRRKEKAAEEKGEGERDIHTHTMPCSGPSLARPVASLLPSSAPRTPLSTQPAAKDESRVPFPVPPKKGRPADSWE